MNLALKTFLLKTLELNYDSICLQAESLAKKSYSLSSCLMYSRIIEIEDGWEKKTDNSLQYGIEVTSPILTGDNDMTTNEIRKNGIINGGIIGLAYILFIYLASSVTGSGFSLNMYSIIMMILGIVAGMIGGVIRSKFKIVWKNNRHLALLLIERKSSAYTSTPPVFLSRAPSQITILFPN